MQNKINTISIYNLSYFKILFLFHIFVVTIFLFYIGLRRNKLSIWIYHLMILIGIILILYHIYRILTEGLKYPVWNYLHIFIFAPLLIYIGIKQRETNKIYYDFILSLASASLGINLFYLYRSLKY